MPTHARGRGDKERLTKQRKTRYGANRGLKKRKDIPRGECLFY